eukprot:scaffold1192_cov169-Amphora_coffeaeformis.AAC.2
MMRLRLRFLCKKKATKVRPFFIQKAKDVRSVKAMFPVLDILANAEDSARWIFLWHVAHHFFLDEIFHDFGKTVVQN